MITQDPRSGLAPMADSFTFKLDGAVTLADYEHAMHALHGLVEALQKQVAPDTHIAWIIEDMDASSALASFVGEATSNGGQEGIAAVVKAYSEVGEALEEGRVVPFPQDIQAKANALFQSIRGSIQSARFEANGVYATVHQEALQALPTPTSIETYGAVEGRLEVLSGKQGVRVRLTPPLGGPAIPCHLSEDLIERVRELWMSHVVIEGTIRRGATTGKPLSVTKVRSIIKQDEVAPGAYRDARGVAPVGDDAVSSEEAIRRIRDG